MNGTIKQLGQALAVLVVAAGAAWTMIEVHAASPHTGTVTDEELSYFKDWIRAENLATRDLLEHEAAAIRSEVRDVRYLLEERVK